MDTRISSDMDLPGIVADLQTPYDILRFVRERTLEFGFSHFTIMKAPSLGETRVAELSMLTNWPGDLIKAYDDMEIGAASPVMRRLTKSALCFQFDVEAINANRTDGKTRDVVELFHRFAMKRGAYFSVYSPLFGAGAVGYGGKREELAECEMMELQMFSICIFDRLVQLREPVNGKKLKLSERERECLRWTAEGKTSFEIGKIVGISEHTVNYYLNTASGKLNSTNRVQAVAVALRNGLLG
jgi:LuxR family transcriptional regulator, quorum-sensing system regulator BjaR1